MQKTEGRASPAGAVPPADCELKSRATPSGAELGYTLLAMCSFAAALYALWLASGSAGLTVAAGGLGSGPAGSGTASPVESAQATVAWIPAVLACLAAAGLIWISFRMLGKSSALATGRHLFTLTQTLAIPDVIKLDVMLAAAGAEFRQFAPTFAAHPQDDGAIRAMAAGKWVIERFGEGSAIVAVPENVAASENFRAAVGGMGERSIQVLRNDPPSRKAEDVA
jgi:hypothetical protein